MFEIWRDKNVVDRIWQSMREPSVADSFKSRLAEAAPIVQYSGGLLVYTDGTVGMPKYKIFDGSSGLGTFGTEQSATSVGSVAIEWVRVVASPINDEWIIATRDAGDVIKAQICSGVDGGVSCGSATTITATAGAHGFRNYDIAFEQSSGDALLVYGTATTDELRKIEWVNGSWSNDAQITTTRTSGAVEWVELTSRPGSNEIGIAYSDTNDDVSAYKWNGSATANEPGQAITTSASVSDLRKFDISFEGLSGDMVVYASANGGGTAYEGYLSGTTWTFTSRTGLDMTTDFIDAQEPGAYDTVAMFAHGDAASSNPSEGWVYEGDGTITDGGNGDDIIQNWAASYQLGAVSYFSSTYRGVAVISSVTGAGADDIDWWTSASNHAITNQTVNARSRGAARFIDLFDYPSADRVLLLTADANSDLWADVWVGIDVDGTAWTDLTSGGALETSLASVTTDVVDFAFRLAPLTTFEQSAYRFFNNADSTDVGSALAIQDSSATLTSSGQAFRLRMLLHIGTTKLNLNGQGFKLQFAERSVACDTGFSGETYADVTGSTVIAFNTANSPADGDNLTANVNDPTHGGDTVVNQDYEEANNFTNTVAAIPSGQDGKWDFSLKDNSAPGSTSYCFRVRKSDDTDVNTYSVIPEIATFQAATVSCSASTSTTAFGSILPISVYTSSPNATITSSCTYGSGCTISVDDAGSGSNPGLWKSTATTYLIASADALLVAGTDGYGIQVATTSSGSGAVFSVNSKYLKTGDSVGGLVLTSTQIASTTSTYTSRELTITHKATVGYLAEVGSYTDTITYSCVGN